MIRIVKNIVMLPIEGLILMVVFRAMIPPLTRIGCLLTWLISWLETSMTSLSSTDMPVPVRRQLYPL